MTSLAATLVLLFVPHAPQKPKATGLLASGRVTTVDGRPVVGAEVRIEGTNDLSGIQTFTLKTGADGRYSGRIMHGIYRVRAWVPRSYNGVVGYWLGTEPKKGAWNDEFDTHKGPILRDFVWKLVGTKTGKDPKDARNSWGGFGAVNVGIQEYEDRERFPKFPKAADVELVFTPTMKLIDGSAGNPVRVVFKNAVSATNMKEAETWGRALAGYYRDLPVGVYSVAANFLLPDGGSVPADIAATIDLGDGGEVLRPQASQTIQWRPARNSEYETRSVAQITLYVMPR